MTGAILIADDEEDILGLLRIHLQRFGHTVVAARDGEEALRLAGEQPLVLAVLDISMPGLNGIEVTRRLRAAEATRELPIILLSALVQPSDIERGLAAGANAYLRKPFTADQLRAQVGALL